MNNSYLISVLKREETTSSLKFFKVLVLHFEIFQGTSTLNLQNYIIDEFEKSVQTLDRGLYRDFKYSE